MVISRPSVTLLGTLVVLLFATAVSSATAEDITVATNARLAMTGPPNVGGFVTAPAGDVNGDGHPDMLVSTPSQAVSVGGGPARSNAGEAWVVFGLPTRGAFDVSALGADGFRMIGATGDFAGASLVALGDVNGDGKGDILVGAPNPSSTVKGAAYVVFGKADGADVDLATFTGASTQGYRIVGDLNGERFGQTAAALGDLNGDGRTDVVIGAPFFNNGSVITGAAYVVYTHAAATDVDTAVAGSGYQIKGAASGDSVGSQSVAGPGDFNGDGVPDVLVAGYQHTYAGRPGAGAAYVVYGQSTPPGAPIELSALGAGGLELEGAQLGDDLGYYVSGAGDSDGDGKADIAVSALFANPSGRSDAGTIYVVRGRAASGLIDMQSPPAGYGYEIDGAVANAKIGRQTGGRDLTGDALPDLTITDSTVVGHDQFSSNLFALSVLPGQAGNTTIDLGAPPSPLRRYIVRLGSTSFQSSPDLDGDGLPDYLVGQNGTFYVMTGSLAPVVAPPVVTPPVVAPPVVPIVPPVVTAPTPPKKPAVTKLSAASIVALPSARQCVSRRLFSIHLKIPKSVKLASATVVLNGRKVRVVKGKQLASRIDLRGLPKGTFTVAITLKATDGRTAKSTRTYHTCVSKPTAKAKHKH